VKSGSTILFSTTVFDAYVLLRWTVHGIRPKRRQKRSSHVGVQLAAQDHDQQAGIGQEGRVVGVQLEAHRHDQQDVISQAALALKELAPADLLSAHLSDEVVGSEVLSNLTGTISFVILITLLLTLPYLFRSQVFPIESGPDSVPDFMRGFLLLF